MKIYEEAQGGKARQIDKRTTTMSKKNNPMVDCEKKTTQMPVVSTHYKITFTPSDTAIYHDFLAENKENNFKKAEFISLFLPSLFSCSTLDN